MIKQDKLNMPIFGLILALLALAPLGMLFPLASVVLIVLGGGIIILFTRGSRFFLSTVLGCIAAVFLLGIELSSTAICAILFCALSASYILNSEKKPLAAIAVTILAAVLGFAVSLLVLSDLSVALFTPALLIVVLFVTVSIKYCFSRTAGIAFISVGIAIPVAAALLIALWNFKGSISSDAVRSALDDGRAWLTNYIKDAVSLMTGLLPEGAQSSSATAELFSDQNIEELVTSLFNIVPAISVITISAAAFAVQRLTYIFISASGEGKRITQSMGLFRMSAVSGVLFILAVLVSFISSRIDSDTSQFISLVSGNLYLILMPGLVGTGFVLLFVKIRSGKMRKPGIFTIILGIMTAIIMPSALILIIAYFGATCVIYEELVEFIKSKKDNNR